MKKQVLTQKEMRENIKAQFGTFNTNRAELKETWLKETKSLSGLIRFCKKGKGASYVINECARVSALHGVKVSPSELTIKNLVTHLKNSERYHKDGTERKYFSTNIIALTIGRIARAKK